MWDMSTRQMNFSTAGIEWNVQVIGNGHQTIVALHGFGQNGELLAPLLRHLPSDEYRLLLIDLPGFKNTNLPDAHIRNGMVPESIAKGIDQIIAEYGTDQLHYLGYSLGGRYLLNQLMHGSKSAGQITLIAPDGFRSNKFRRFLTSTWFGNKLFRWFTRYPGFVFALVETAYRLRLISTSRYRFFFMHLKSAERRQTVYDVWMALRKMHIDLTMVCKTLQSKKTNMLLIGGKFDRIIPPEDLKKFCDTCDSSDYGEIRDGHNLLRQRNIKAIADLAFKDAC